MTIVPVAVTDLTNPVEVQSWLDAHSSVTILTMWNNGNTFFIVYQ